MDEALDPKWLQRQRRILGARAATAGDAALESVSIEESVGAEAPLPHPDEVLQRVNEVVSEMPPAEIGDPDEFARALETLFKFGDPALKNLASGAAISPDEAVALEAIIETDGSRPSFLLENGLPPADHPFLGNWKDAVAGARQAIRDVAQAVGRVQPKGGNASRYVGTATLFQSDPPRALTNFHVLDDARIRHGIKVETRDGKTNVGDGLEIDFVGESAGFATNSFTVVGADLPENHGRGFGHVDAAVLHLEPRAGAELPTPFTAFSAKPAYATGGLSSLCTIGFPGPPNVMSSGSVDWNWVIGTLFNNLFGYKRVAPGLFMSGLGSHQHDTLAIALSHDATTFGGASGSLVLAWADDGPPAFGLHFGGKTGDANYMISTAKAADALRAIGVPV